MGFADFGVGLAQAWKGFDDRIRQGEVDQRARDAEERTKARDEYERGLRADEIATRPERQAIEKKQRDAVNTDLDIRAETAPQRKELAGLEVGNAIAEARQKQEAITSGAIAASFKRNQDVAAMVDDFYAEGGKLIATNSLDRLAGHLSGGLNSVFGDKIVPGIAKMGQVKTVEPDNAPKGSTTLTGAPIEGKALRLSFDSGATAWINPNDMLSVYQQRKTAIDAKNAKVVGEGQTLVGADGRPIYAAPPRANAYNTTGAIGGIRGSAAGVGAAGGGKAAQGGQASAMKMLEEFSKREDGKNMPTEAIATAGTYVSTLFADNPNMDPAQAAQIAWKAAANPAAVAPKIDVKTGEVFRAFRDSTVAGGRIFNLGAIALDQQGVESIKDKDGKPVGKAYLQKEVGAMMEAQTPEQREVIVAAAKDQNALKTLRTKAESSIASINEEAQKAITDVAGLPDAEARIAAIRERLNSATRAAMGPYNKAALVAQFSPPPADKKPVGGASRDGEPAQSFGIGGARGMTPSEQKIAVEKAKESVAAKKKQPEDTVAVAARAESATSLANELLARDRNDLSAVRQLHELQASPDFDALPKELRVAIFKRINLQD